MTSKKQLALIVVTVCLLFVFTTASVMGAEITLRVSNAGPAVEDDRTYIANNAFKNMVESRTDGRIEVITYHASELADERGTFEGMQIGIIEMGTLSTGALPGFLEEILVLGIPYTIDSAPVAWELMEGPFGDRVEDELVERGIRPLAWSEHGFRNYTNNVRPINSPEDMEGLTIRTMENPAHMMIVEALGGDPTPMALPELYTAMDEGVVDGQENPLSLIYSMAMYEVQDYLSIDQHVYDFITMYISEEVYQQLDDADKRLLHEAAQVWKSVHNGYSTVQIQESIKEMEDEFEEITYPDIEEFKEATQQQVIDEIEEIVGSEWVEFFLESVEEAEEAVYGGL